MPTNEERREAAKRKLQEQLATRSRKARQRRIVSVVGALIATPELALGWQTPQGWDWALFVGLGASGALGHFLLIGAFKHAPASTLAPFSYVQIVWSTMMGYLVFSNVPDLMTFVGAAIIIASGVYLVLRERQLGRGIAARAERPT